MQKNREKMLIKMSLLRQLRMCEDEHNMLTEMATLHHANRLRAAEFYDLSDFWWKKLQETKKQLEQLNKELSDDSTITKPGPCPGDL